MRPTKRKVRGQQAPVADEDMGAEIPLLIKSNGAYAYDRHSRANDPGADWAAPRWVEHPFAEEGQQDVEWAEDGWVMGEEEEDGGYHEEVRVRWGRIVGLQQSRVVMSSVGLLPDAYSASSATQCVSWQPLSQAKHLPD